MPYMNRSLIFTGLLGLAVSCVSPQLNNNEMKKDHLTYFSFDHHNSMSMHGEKYDVSYTKDGRINVVIDEGSSGEKEFYLSDSVIFDELLAIMETYKTDKYKENYKPKGRITDGDSWSLYYKYVASAQVVTWLGLTTTERCVVLFQIISRNGAIIKRVYWRLTISSSPARTTKGVTWSLH